MIFSKKRKRVGRGPGSKHGKTCGRGMSGQKSRSGSSMKLTFEGGQVPFARKIRKVGFSRESSFQEMKLSKLLEISFKKEIINQEAISSFADKRFHQKKIKVILDRNIPQNIKVDKDFKLIQFSKTSLKYIEYV